MSAAPVLCVEDHADTRDLLKSLLELSGIEAAVAPDAGAALPLIEVERFSLYILDGGLGRTSGLALCERIRASDADTPIVFFSGHAYVSDIEAGMHAGANAYIVKPNISEIIPTVKRLLAQARAADSQPLQSSN